MKDRLKTSVPLIAATHSIQVLWERCCCSCRPVAQLLPHFSRGPRSPSQIPTWSIVIHHEKSGSHSKLKDTTLGQIIDSLDKYHGYSGNLVSSLQQCSLIQTHDQAPRLVSLEHETQFADLEEKQSDGQGSEEREIKSPATKQKVQQKRVFVSRILRDRGELSSQ